MKALGKRPPELKGYNERQIDECEGAVRYHYRQALIEAADELEALTIGLCMEKVTDKDYESITPRLPKLAKKLRISAGEKE